jgi:PAS domain S-box-containing protein
MGSQGRCGQQASVKAQAPPPRACPPKRARYRHTREGGREIESSDVSIRGRPLRVRLGTILVLLVVVTTVPLGLFAGNLIYKAWQQQQALVNRQNVERARTINSALDQEVQTVVGELRVLATIVPIDTGDLRPFHGFASDMVGLLGWDAVRLVDPSSRVLVNTALPFGTPSAIAKDDWIRAVRDTKKPAVSAATLDLEKGQYYVSIAVPVLRRDRLQFVLAARVPASDFSAVVQRQPIPADGVVALMDSELTIMGRTRAAERYIGRKPTQQFAAAIRSGPEGSLRSSLLEGTPSYSAYSTSPLTGWTVGIGVPSDAVDRPLWRWLGLLISGVVALLGGGLLMALFVRRRIVRAQIAAVAAARALARGEPVSLPHSRVREFNDLANGLTEAATILSRRLRERDAAEAERAEAVENLELALAGEQAARAAGERNEARLSVTLRSIGDAVIATDADGLVTVLNPVAQALTGWPESEAIGEHIDTVFETVDEHTRRPNPSPLTRVLAAETSSAPLPSHHVLMARDGRDVPIGDSAAALRSPDGTLLGIVVVFRDMSAEREAERQRAAALEREQAARRAAETLSRAKDEFVATVSHELRTPLNAIFGWVAMLKMGTLDAAGETKALDVIDRNARVQAQLIEDLLDMARVIRGTVRLDMQPVDLAVVLEAALDAVKPAADARRVTIKMMASRGTAVVSGDSGRLQQIVWNLMSNAIKFSEAGDEVMVLLETDENDAVLQVRDTGTGIDPAFLPHVFDRFRQETSDVTREHAGLGLGLSLVRHLAELHGGTVSAESTGKAQGATFTMRLPLISARAGKELDFLTQNGTYAPDVKPDALKDLDVMIVEDDADTRELIRTVLHQAGAAVSTASSVRDAVDVLELHRPDLVITDIAMPHATGFDLVKRMREDPRWSELPVIALTAYGRPEDRAQAMSLGFHAHVGKPFSPRALVAVAAELVRR